MSFPLFYVQYLILILLLDIKLSFIPRDLKMSMSFSGSKSSFISVIIQRVSLLSHILVLKNPLEIIMGRTESVKRIVQKKIHQLILQLPAVRKQGTSVCVCVGECLHVSVFRLKDSIVRSKKGPPLSRCEGESFQIQKFDPNS